MTPTDRIVENQSRTFLRLLTGLRPRWRRDRALPVGIQRLLSGRAFGARDRRLYRELIYTTLRYLPWIERWLDHEPARAVQIAAWLAADNRDTHAFRSVLCADWPKPGPLATRAAHLGEEAAALLPAWFRAECQEIFAPAELEAQLARAPLWLRLQTDKPEKVFAEFATRGWTWTESGAIADTIRLELGEQSGDVTDTDAYRSGQVEIQDLGSQLVLASAGVDAGGRWLDACAGAGGKTLQLARLIGPSGQVDAQDPRPGALAELKLRAARAGLTNIQLVARPTARVYDAILVDAPCSGTGTWRRAPHLKWCTTPADLERHPFRQGEILRQHAPLVRPGGRMIYATCSLSSRENEEVAARFLAVEPGFAAEPVRERFGYPGDGPTLTILPGLHDTDGFFVAVFRRV